ncbi:MAG TPA: hypothetical protein VGM82_06185 [Gemmatimonadaceae bacterium]
MPSVLVLLLGSDAALASVTDAVVAGAKQVRFAEVTVRAAQPDVFRYQPLDADAALGSYDGIVFVASDDGSVDELQRITDTHALTNTVMSRAGSANAKFSAALVALGGIVVSADDASAIGQRVAKVSGWVRHSLGHEAEHHHHDDHGHDHHHGHDHSDHDHQH